MKTMEKNVLSLAEIKRRVNEIRENWGPYERLARRTAGQARCEFLEALIGAAENRAAKAA